MKTDDTYLESLMSRLDSAMSGRQVPAPVQPAPANAPVDRKPAEAADSPEERDAPSLRQQIVEQRFAAGASGTQVEDKVEELGHDPDPVPGEFWPLAPADWTEMRTTPTAAEELTLKFLMSRGTASGRDIADHIAVPFGLLSALLQQLKNNRLVVHRGAAQFGDYLYHLTESGIETANRYLQQNAYDGAAPITLAEYVASVERQSIHRNPPTLEEIASIFHDLVLDDEVLDQVGQAIRAGYGFFLYGDSGNGKTSVAERVSRAFGKTIWIPRSLTIDGAIVRLFDPCNHVEVPPTNKDGLYDQLKIDRRWVRIRRPTILVGGELTLDRLEIRSGAAPGIYEAPVQLKSNGGTLVIDDFGRQRVRAVDLLNRWIVPLDRRVDFLQLPNGKSIQVPFDQLLIFSTNMQPHELADEAFLRRIPYKIRITDPSELNFTQLFEREAGRLGVRYDAVAVQQLIQTHYVEAGRPFRCCHARDLLQHVKHYCEFKRLPLEMSRERFAIAVRNYFAAVG